jgi:hypothetical protein
MDKPMRSLEFQHYCKTLSCPVGHRGTLRFIEGTGRIITNLQLRDRLMLRNPMAGVRRSPSMKFIDRLGSLNDELFQAVTIIQFRTDSLLECVQCNQRWPVFLDQEMTFDVIKEYVGREYATVIGTDKRRLVSSREVGLTLEVEKRWRKRIEFDWEKVRVQGISGEARVTLPLTIGGDFLARLQPRFETTVKSRNNIVEETETVQKARIDLSHQTRWPVNIIIHWKQNWQEMICDIRLVRSGTIYQVSYRKPLEVGYDVEVK